MQTPKEIVKILDEYIIGQEGAKKTIAIALRNRYRRLSLSPELQSEITPKNILMIGQTGVGKTEIARRIARFLDMPFVKVEASKYTEVGYVGRDVESMVRDLVMASMHIVSQREKEILESEIQVYINRKITQILLPSLPKNSSDEKMAEYERSFEKMLEKVQRGDMDKAKIELVVQKKVELNDMDPQAMQQNFMDFIFNAKGGVKKEMSIKQAKRHLREEAFSTLSDTESLKQRALDLAQSGGIIFIDEIDKIAVGSSSKNSSDPSKEGVQRDLLPIVEGSVVNTKLGQIKTDNILFIAAGAFHLSKPSDLIPELQGRFPIRVELSVLDSKSLYLILRSTKNSLISQYKALLSVEGISLEFDDSALVEIAELAMVANEKTEDIGARRLHTIIEKLLEDISFEGADLENKNITITKEFVRDKLQNLVQNTDLSRYIL